MKIVKTTLIALLNLQKNYRQITDFYFLVFKKMYPNKVYHCLCVSLEIKLCLVNGQYSLKDFCKRLNQSKDHRKLYCCKCGDGCVIFSCLNHIPLVIIKKDGSYFKLNQKTKNCRRCLRRYLQLAYSCCYEHTDFDVPIAIKKKKKVLCLRVMNNKI